MERNVAETRDRYELDTARMCVCHPVLPTPFPDRKRCLTCLSLCGWPWRNRYAKGWTEKMLGEIFAENPDIRKK